MAQLQIRMNTADWNRNAALFEGRATEVARRANGTVTVTGDLWDGMADKKPIKGAWRSFTDFLAPSVWFIFGSLSFGMVFTKTGLTRRLAYKMLSLVGEKTSMIYLGCFVLTSALTLIMAHTAVAATIYPLLVAIYGLYTTEEKPTKFGKGLFMGMAFVAGAGSIITLLGAARGAVALGFFREVTGQDVGFFELAYYMAPVGVLMTLVLWVFFMVWYKPEKATIPGLRERSKALYAELGGIRRDEIIALVIVGSVIAILGARALMPGDSMIKDIDKAGIILLATVLFFLFRILKLEDLEDTSWNIILLFGGAMSIGYCLWQTGAAEWLAIHWLSMFKTAPGWVFVVAIAFFVMVMTNLIMNVAAIAISMPVALVIAPYLDVAPHVVMFASLVTAGMPFFHTVELVGPLSWLTPSRPPLVSLPSPYPSSLSVKGVVVCPSVVAKPMPAWIQSAVNSQRLPTMSRAPCRETHLAWAALPAVLTWLLPTLQLTASSGVPATAACHSALLHSRLPALAHACWAWNQVMYAEGWRF